MKVPLVDLGAQQAEVAQEVWAGLTDVFARTAFIGGPAVADFERRYADYLGVAHCIGVANGTDALELAMRAAGVQAGAEVVLPANTFIATAEAVARIGARPVLVDVDPDHLLMDPDAVAAAVTSRTAAVVPVHLFGQAAPVELIVKQLPGGELPIVEDAAQSQGATRWGRPAGSLGMASGTSFYPGKNLGAAGDAGAVMTDDAALARTVRLLGAHGSEQKYVHEIVGVNSRLDTVQAVVLTAKLARLTTWNEQRRAAAARYGRLLSGVPGIHLPGVADGNDHVWHLYVVQVDDRDRVLDGLHAAGVGAGIHYPTPLHLTAAFADLGPRAGAFPVAEAAAGRILSLPLYPHISAAQQEYVAETLAALVGA